MPRLAIILTAILSISACGGGSSSEDPSSPQSVPPLTFELFDPSSPQSVPPLAFELFDPSGTDNQIAAALRDSVEKNKQFINFAASFYPVYEDYFNIGGANPIDLIRFSISPDSTSSNIRINAVSVKTKEDAQLNLMLKRVNDKHNIARITLLDTNQNTFGFGLVFPYGIIFDSDRAFLWENNDYTALRLFQGHALLMGTEEWAPRDTKIKFGGVSTRAAGYALSGPSAGLPPSDYPFHLTLELIYRGYSNQHEVTLNVLEFKHNRPDNRFTSSALAADFRTAKMAFNQDSRTNPFVTRENNSQNPNTFMFNSGEYLSFYLNNYVGDVTTDTSNPTPWIEKSSFEATIFGTDINNIYIAGFFLIDINATANNPFEKHFGVFVLPRL